MRRASGPSPDAPPDAPWVIINDDGALQLRIRLTPKSSRDGVDGITASPDGLAIKARVRAVPENGGANKAALALIAKWLSIPKSSITLSAGAKSRTKVLTIITTPTDRERIITQLEKLSMS